MTAQHAIFIEREEARELGLKRYFTGEPCIHGHIEERLVSITMCVGCGREHRARWTAANPNGPKIAAHKSYLKHKDKVNQKVKDRRARDPEYDLRRTRARRAIDPDYRKQYNRDWRAANPDKVRGWWKARRALKHKAGGTYTEQDLFVIFVAQHGLCVCGASLLDSTTEDHIVPLKRGGTNWPSNIQLLCQPCNDSKGKKLMSEWRPAWLKRTK